MGFFTGVAGIYYILHVYYICKSNILYYSYFVNVIDYITYYILQWQKLKDVYLSKTMFIADTNTMDTG